MFLPEAKLLHILLEAILVFPVERNNVLTPVKLWMETQEHFNDEHHFYAHLMFLISDKTVMIGSITLYATAKGLQLHKREKRFHRIA